jgi:hypothetical protein
MNINKDVFLSHYPINKNLKTMTQPEYPFNYNDIMYLGSSIYNKVDQEKQLIQKLLNYSKDVLDDDIFLLNFKPNKIKKIEITKPEDKQEQININTLDLFDYIDKNELDDEKMNKLVKELESKNLNKNINLDALKRFIRTVKFIYLTHKLLDNVRPILKKTFKEIGINIEDPAVQTYLNNIEKGFKNIDELMEIIKNNNVILTDEQNLVILTFLQLVLDNFVDTPIN